MSEQQPEKPTSTGSDADSEAGEPVTLETPQVETVEKGRDQSGIETKDVPQPDVRRDE